MSLYLSLSDPFVRLRRSQKREEEAEKIALRMASFHQREREREYKEDKPFHSPLSMQKREKEKNTAWPLRCLVRHSLAPLPISEFVFFFSFCSFWRADTRCYHLSHFFSLLIVRPTAGRPLEDVLLCPCRFPSRTPRSMLMGDLYIIGLTKRWCQYQISEEGESCAISPSIPLLSVEYGAYCMSGWIRQTSWITRWSSWGPP